MRIQVQPSVRVAKEKEEEEEARGCVIRGAAIQKLVAEQIPFPVAHPLNRFRPLVRPSIAHMDGPFRVGTVTVTSNNC